MDTELKAKWVRALRSGEYKQSRNQLYEDGGYCCLGVLCKVVGLSVERTEDMDGYRDIYNLIGGHSKATELTMRNDGFKSRTNPDHQFHEYSFPEIADYIEANL